MIIEKGKLTSRERFIKVYSNLPMQTREEIIYVSEDKKPLTWNAAYVEVINNTKLSLEILLYLTRLNII